MATPMLITVGALTVGFIALSKARANMPGGTQISAPPEAGDAPGVGVQGLEAAADSPGETVMGENTPAFSSGPRLSMQPSINPGALVTSDANAQISMGGKGPSESPSAPVAAPELPPKLMNAITSGPNVNYAQIMYGSTNVTRVQQSQALSEMGPITGEVW